MDQLYRKAAPSYRGYRIIDSPISPKMSVSSATSLSELFVFEKDETTDIALLVFILTSYFRP